MVENASRVAYNPVHRIQVRSYTNHGFALRTHPLCRRNSYFAVINLIGGDVFNFVEDYHRQRDGVIETEAARIDDMIERIRHAVD